MLKDIKYRYQRKTCITKTFIATVKTSHYVLEIAKHIDFDSHASRQKVNVGSSPLCLKSSVSHFTYINRSVSIHLHRHTAGDHNDDVIHH